MKHIGWYVNETKGEYTQIIDRYKAKNCKGCFLRTDCHRQEGNRKIEAYNNYKRLKDQADKRLKSNRGIKKRKKRCWDTEPVFGNIKHNHHFKRFMLRGMEKVKVETGLLAMAHNLRKKTA